MMPDAVLFDLDGLLVDSPPLWRQAYIAAARTHGVTLPDDLFLEIFRTNAPFAHAMERLGLPPEIREPFRTTRDDLYVALMEEHLEWVEGAERVLTEIGEIFPTAIITSSRQRYVDAIHRRTAIRDFVRLTVDLEGSSGRHKPDPHPLLHAAALLGVRPEMCFYAGDQLTDIRAAQAAKMLAILIPHPFTPAEAHEHADVVLTDISALPNILQKVHDRPIARSA